MHPYAAVPSPPPPPKRTCSSSSSSPAGRAGVPTPTLAAPRPPRAPHSPRVGLLRHGADSRGLCCRLGPGRARRQGNKRAAGSLGPGAEGAAAARRSLARSLAHTAGGRAGKVTGGERPGSEADPLPGPRGGAGSALGLPHRRRRRRLRCGSKPNMAAAAAALRTRGPRGGRTARGPRAHCALGRRGAALVRRRRRPGDMAGGRRRRRRRLRGALGGEARPLGSHPPRGGEEGAGGEPWPCVGHVPKTRSRDARAPPLAPGPCAETSVPRFEATVARSASGGCAASRRLVPPPPHAGRSPLGGPLPFPFPRGCCSQPVRNPVRVC